MKNLIINSCDGKYSSSLDVRFTKDCDNNCPFCIEKNGIDGGKLNVEKMIASTVESQKQEILILGGEPLLKMNDVLKYIKGIRKHVDKIYLTTSIPETIIKNIPLFLEILSLIDGINVSLQHYDNIKNNEIMRSSNFKFKRIDALQKLCEYTEFANKARVSINLVKGAIDNKISLDMFLNTMVSIGVKHVKINELQNSDDIYVNFEKIYGVKYKSPYAFGCQEEITLPNYKNLKITLKRACFKVAKELEMSPEDKLKIILSKKIPYHVNTVLYEDGTLSNGWKQKTK